jgi:glycosyltransferase involved in cell wall biosynthesis
MSSQAAGISLCPSTTCLPSARTIGARQQLPTPSHISPGDARALVLLATYNGGRYLEEQLASIAAQSIAHVDLLVSDDGSADDTLARLEAWRATWTRGTFTVVSGPRQGFAENFRSLILRAAPPRSSFVAFSDQDDVWDADKLAAAVAVLAAQPADRPALYGSRSRLIDEEGQPFGQSPLFPHPPAFRNAIVQSLAGGNTMVFNGAGFALLRESARRTGFLMHDWWSYLIVSGAGGVVHYDRTPHIGYRQHRGNAIGGGIGLLDRPKRMMELLAGKFSRWSDENIASLNACRDLLSADSRQVLAQFEQLRAAHALAVPGKLLHSGIYRQTVKGNVALGLAALLHRL